MSSDFWQTILDVNEDNKIGCVDVLFVGGVGFSDVFIIIIIASCFLIRKTMIVASGKLYQPPLAFILKTPAYYHTIKK